MKCEFCGNYLNIVKCADDYTELRLEDESIFKINWGVSFFFLNIEIEMCDGGLR